MPTWDILDEALSRLESPAFDGRWYALAFRERLEAELKRIFDWSESTDGIVELHPSKGAVVLCEIVFELKGVDAVGPCDIVREAMLILDGQRVDGRLPASVLNNYFTLRYALEFGDCEDWSVISLAKSIIFANR